MNYSPFMKIRFGTLDLLTLLVLLSSLTAHALEVTMKTTGGVLKGTIEEVKGVKSSIVLIHPGSGPTDRDGNSALLPGKNNSLKYLAEHLKNKGIPSLRIDKRGIAASAAAGPKEKDLRFETYVNDTVSWVKHLQQIGYQNIIILGHSEGSLIGMLATQKENVSGYISIAGPARSADQLLLQQLRPNLIDHPELLNKAEKIVSQLKKGKTSKNPPANLAPIFRPSVQPYMISWFKYDPTLEIAKIKQPILIVQGSTDVQVPISAAKKLHAAVPNSQLVIIDSMNHVLKNIQGDVIQQLPSYSNPKLPLNQKLGETIVQFVKKSCQ